MTTYNILQNYWWLIMSVLGALLVFLLMVQGGQSMLIHYGKPDKRALLINSMGRKWELTYTTLVTFGGAFFASFPLFYSTSFGGAYWLWMLILFSFVIQAISYEYRSKPGNIYGSRFYDTLLLINGIVGPVLLGVAVATMFFGAEFTVTKSNILNVQGSTISQWGPQHGLEAIICWKNLLFGVMVFFLARTLASLYFINNIDDDHLDYFKDIFFLMPIADHQAIHCITHICFLIENMIRVMIGITGMDGTLDPYMFRHDLKIRRDPASAMDIQQFFDILQEGLDLRIIKIHSQTLRIDADVFLHVLQRFFQRSAICCVNGSETDKAFLFTADH